MIDIYKYRITKYNPSYRNREGVYIHDDWSSISEIGKVFNNNSLSFESYKTCEDAYVKAINLIIDTNKITNLQVEGFEKGYIIGYPDMKECDIQVFFNKVKNGICIGKQEIELISRLTLREMMWCKLTNEQLYVHFGYDYYMYVGSVKELTNEVNMIQDHGLFVEKFASPYL